MNFNTILRLALVFTLMLLVLGNSGVIIFSIQEQTREFTRQIEFDYVDWTLEALAQKAVQSAMGTQRMLPVEQQRQIVFSYLQLINQERQIQDQINQIYADPSVKNPAVAAAGLQSQLADRQNQIQQIAPLVESILQQQISTVLAELGLSLGGQPIPPLLYHVTPLPNALIISPRSVIRQDADISLQPDLTVAEKNELETEIEAQMDVSALVVPVGGVGIYPTMVMESYDLSWLIETVSHEWTHNFLTLRPLGVNYYTSPELRTMNETTASIAGTEICEVVIAKFYPEYLPQPQPEHTQPLQVLEEEPTPPEFDYRAEMHTTRVMADSLLEQGKIEEAENYMETRRQFFVANGYPIRKLNQAYFAFYGAYADQPGGAAGQDPVGPAVRALREQNSSLADFINQMSWMTSFAQLQKAVD